MTMISSQDFRNKYEVFYDAMRLYLWPYDILELLGNVEIEIYTDFPDMEKLRNYFSKLKTNIKEVLAEDEDLAKACKALEDLINEEHDENSYYYTISRVAEANQEKNKVLKNPSKEEDDELKGGISYENKQSGIINKISQE